MMIVGVFTPSAKWTSRLDCAIEKSQLFML